MAPDKRQRVSFVTLVLCLVAAFLLVVHAHLVAWTIWLVSVGFCATMIWINRPGGSGQR